MRRWTIAGALVVVLAAGVSAQAPTAVESERVKTRQRIFMMEGVLERAVQLGVDNLRRRVRAIMPEFQIDRVLIATEATSAAPERVAELRALLDPIPLVEIDHLELKRLSRDGRATIRTADTALYANIIIVSG